MGMRYKLTSVLLAKDEGEYLPEWLGWHFGHGIEHVYLYDDSRGRPMTEFLEEYAPRCTVKDAARYRYHLQFEAYVDALRRFGRETEWMAFIDADEYLRSVGGTPITDILDTMPDNAAAVLCPWVIYNANGHLTKTPGPVRERFTETVPWPWVGIMPNWKSIVRPALVTSMSAHSPIKMKDGAMLADANGDIVTDKYHLPPDKLVVDHYYTKSYEEWLYRLPKGSCDPFAARKMEWFETLNPGLLGSAGLTIGESPQKLNSEQIRGDALCG